MSDVLAGLLIIAVIGFPTIKIRDHNGVVRFQASGPVIAAINVIRRIHDDEVQQSK